MISEYNVFSINLLLKDRVCLVVGGGKVANRKIEGLINSNAKIKVITKKTSSRIQELADDNKIQLELREFNENDLNEVFLVFAATDDRKLNSHIVKSCENKGILSCAVDDNWLDGTFITPATFNKSGVNVAISSGGKSCRRTRLIKDSIARHIKMVDKADLMIIGTDHNFLKLTEREPLHLTGERYTDTCEMLMHIWGIHSFMLINTCNRIELAAIVNPELGVERTIKRVIGFNHLKEDNYYLKYGEGAFRHLSIVTAGLMSQTPGENHITAQVKNFVSRAVDNGWGGSMLQEWINNTLHISKHIRNETSPLLKNYEVEDLCLNYVDSEFGDVVNKNILVLGAGMSGKKIVKNLVSKGAFVNWCYHKNKPDLTGYEDKINLFQFNSLKEYLVDADLIITATSSPTPLIHQGHAPFFDSFKNILALDLSIPRNVAPDLNKFMPNIKVIDLDDLKYWYRREACDLNKVFEISNGIVNDHLDLYDKLLYSFQGQNKSQL